MMAALRIGTRKSALALAQTKRVCERLAALYPAMRLEIADMTTAGDIDQKTSLSSVADKGFFTQAIEEGLREKTIDIAVHSLKDLPTVLDDDFTIGAYCFREDARDAFLSRGNVCFGDLPEGARVGTSSVRRKAQILAMRPDLTCVEVRGNLQTRWEKLERGEEMDAMMLAMAGLVRMGWQDRVTEVFSYEQMLPAPGQGIIAVECLKERTDICELLASLNDEKSAQAAIAERTFLQAMGGGCLTPLGAHASFEEGNLVLEAGVFQQDGSAGIRVTCEGLDAEELGRAAAREVLSSGGEELLVAESASAPSGDDRLEGVLCHG